LKSFETRNKAEEQTNSTSYQALSGHFVWKTLYTYKKLRNKVVPYGAITPNLLNPNQYRQLGDFLLWDKKAAKPIIYSHVDLLGATASKQAKDFMPPVDQSEHPHNFHGS
jgi:hypothetical protein